MLHRYFANVCSNWIAVSISFHTEASHEADVQTLHLWEPTWRDQGPASWHTMKAEAAATALDTDDKTHKLFSKCRLSRHRQVQPYKKDWRNIFKVFIHLAHGQGPSRINLFSTKFELLKFFLMLWNSTTVRCCITLLSVRITTVHKEVRFKFHIYLWTRG